MLRGTMSIDPRSIIALQREALQLKKSTTPNQECSRTIWPVSIRVVFGDWERPQENVRFAFRFSAPPQLPEEQKSVRFF